MSDSLREVAGETDLSPPFRPVQDTEDPLPTEFSADLDPLLDSLAVLRLKTQATNQLKTIIGSHRAPIRVLEKVCARAKAMSNVYAQEACVELIAAVIAETPEPLGQTMYKASIVQSLQELELGDKRVSFAAHRALEQVATHWNATTLAELSIDVGLYSKPKSVKHAVRLRPVQRPVEEDPTVAFGFLPRDVYDQLYTFPGNLRPASLIQTLETSFQAVHLPSLQPHYGPLLDFLSSMLSDKHVRTKTSILGLLLSLYSVQGISLSVDLVPQAERLLPIFGDVNIHVRQAVFRCLRTILREIRIGKLLDVLAMSLKSDNWHQREEVLKLFIVAMLAVDEAHNIDFLELVPLVTPLMDDETPKVRYVAVETLCALACISGSQRVEKELQPLMDEVALGLLKARFARKTIPVVREDTVEFPRETPLSAPVSTKNIHHIAPSGPKTPSTFSFAGLDTPTLLPSHSASLLPTSRVRIQPLDTPLPKVREVRALVGSHSTADMRSEHRRSGRLRATLASLKQEESAFPRNSSLPTIGREADRPQAYKTLSASTSSGSYLKPEELEAPENTSAELAKVTRGLQAIEWAEQFETLNLIRKLLKFSPEVFKSTSFPEVLRQVLLWAESLRSSLSKNALIVLGEMCEFLPRGLEGDLEQLLSLVLRKSVDTNMFISEVASKTLEQMCQYLSDGRLITCLLTNIAAIRSSLVKAKTATCFELLIARLKGQFPKIRDFARVVKTLYDYTQDASVEVRSAAKRAFQRLSQETSQDDIDRYMSRILPSKSFEQFRDSQQSWSAPEDLRPKQHSAREAGKREGAVRRLVIRSSRAADLTPASERETMQEVAAALRGPVWKQRYDAVSRASAAALQAAETNQTMTLSQAVECLCTGVADTSLKVSYHSVNCLKKLLVPLQHALPQHMPTLVLALGQALSTSNSSLKSLSIEVLANILGHSEISQSLPSLINAFGQVTGRGKIGLLKLITEVLPSSPNRDLILKHAVPVAKALLSDWRTELQAEAVEFLDRLGTLIELREVLSEEQLLQLSSHLSRSV